MSWLGGKFVALRMLVERWTQAINDRFSARYPHGIVLRAVLRNPRFRGIRVLVESGTFRGKTTAVESRYFRTVHTIELNVDLYAAAQEKFHDVPNVHCHHGDSGAVIPKLVDAIDEAAVFFLDAHWSGDSSVDWSDSNWEGYGVDTAYRGETWPPTPEQQCPLLDESKAIGRGFPHRAIVIVDDWSVVGTRDLIFKGEDWSAITLDGILRGLGPERVVDRFIAVWENKPRMVFVLAERRAQ